MIHGNAGSLQPGGETFHGSLCRAHAQVEMVAKSMDILHFWIVCNDLARCHLILRIQLQDATLERTVNELARPAK